MSSRNIGTSWKKEVQWLTISNEIMTTLQTTDILPDIRKAFERVQDRFTQYEILMDNISIRLEPKSSFKVKAKIGKVQTFVFPIKKPEIEY